MLLFVLGIACALRAGKGHRSLRSIGFQSQFRIKHDAQGVLYLEYREDLGLKTNKGGLKHVKMNPKVVNIYPISDVSRCPVHIFQVYMSKLPAAHKSSALYLRPLTRYTQSVWFRNAPIDINTLHSTVRVMCEQAGLAGFYTNHSLRASPATRMYNTNCPEQVIQERTGHRSLAVRSYKKTSLTQKHYANYVLFEENNCEGPYDCPDMPPAKRPKY